MNVLCSSGEKDATVAEYFNEYQSRVINSLSEYQNSKQHIQDLQAEVETLRRERDVSRKLLDEREHELEAVSKKLMTKTSEVLEKAEKISTDLGIHKKVINLQYDIDVSLSANRSLEKDLILQKTENERLRNMNSQLTRELQYCRMQLRNRSQLSAHKQSGNAA